MPGTRRRARAPGLAPRVPDSRGRGIKSTHGHQTEGPILPAPGSRASTTGVPKTHPHSRLPWSPVTADKPDQAGVRPRQTRTRSYPAAASPRTRPDDPARPHGGRTGKSRRKDGLPSADRNNKATLLLTGPFRTAKSSAKDLTPLVLKLQYAKYHGALRAPRRNRLLRR